MMTRLVVITTPGEPLTDEDDNPVTIGYGEPVMGEPTVITLDPAAGPAAYLEQASTTEITVGQQTAPGTWWAGLPTGTPVKETSSLHFPDSGQTFQVAGEPADRWNPWERRVEFVRVELSTETA